MTKLDLADKRATFLPAAMSAFVLACRVKLVNPFATVAREVQLRADGGAVLRFGSAWPADYWPLWLGKRTH
jgi:hypothetical protein